MAFDLIFQFFSSTVLKATYSKKVKIIFFQVIIVSVKSTGTDCFVCITTPVHKQQQKKNVRSVSVPLVFKCFQVTYF